MDDNQDLSAGFYPQEILQHNRIYNHSQQTTCSPQYRQNQDYYPLHPQHLNLPNIRYDNH